MQFLGNNIEKKLTKLFELYEIGRFYSYVSLAIGESRRPACRKTSKQASIYEVTFAGR